MPDENEPLTTDHREAMPRTSRGTSRTLGPYKLLDLLGCGGMGEVWMAEQRAPVRRRVAVKLIRAGMDSDEVVARFEAERQALAMMDHPNIAKVLDAGQTNDGQPYFVMELVKGIPITKYCDKHKLPLEARLRLFASTCKAVQHAHHKGIIHRDIKPSNVLVTAHDDKPAPKVIDFGLAKALQHQTRLTDRTLYTELGQVVGTVQYMSPEQAEMNGLNVDTRTDIYSLGVLLYELMTGSTPLDKKTVADRAMLEVLRYVAEFEPARPSTRLSESGDAIDSISAQRGVDRTKLMQTLKGDLDWVVMKALERDRTRRYPTADAFSEDVEHYLNDEAVEARPPSFGYQLQKTFRRHRVAVLTAAVILVSLLAGIVGTTIQTFRATAAERMARDAERLAKAETARAEEALVALETRRKEADEAREEALAQKQQAVAQRDKTQQLMDYQSAEYALRDGDLHEAMQRLTAADRLSSNWEYGNFFGQIVNKAHEYFVPVRRWKIRPNPINGLIVMPKAAADIDKQRIYAVFGYDDELRVYDSSTGEMLASRKLVEPLDGDYLVEPYWLRPEPIASRLDGPPRFVRTTANARCQVFNAADLTLVFELDGPYRRGVTAGATEADRFVAVTAGDVVQVVDSSSGEILAEHRASEVDTVRRVTISPGGDSIMYSSFSTEFAPQLWDWKNDTVLPVPTGLQWFSFADDSTVVGQHSYSTIGENSRYFVMALKDSAVESTASSSFFTGFASDYFSGWRARVGVGVTQYESSAVSMRLILANNERATEEPNSSEQRAPVDISFKQLAGSLLPASSSGGDTRLMDVDESTMGVVVTHGGSAELLAPRNLALSVIDGKFESEEYTPLAQTTEIDCSLWAAQHRGDHLVTYNGSTLQLFKLQNGRPVDLQLVAKVVAPDGLKGQGKRIAFLALNAVGDRVWALWEGADSFYHTERRTSRDLVVACYDLSQQPRKGFLTRLVDRSPPTLSHAYTFRLSEHPTGAVRVGRAYFVSEDEQTLVYAVDKVAAGYDAKTGELRYRLPEAHSFASSRDGRWFATGSWHRDMPTTVWDANNGTKVLETEAKSPIVRMAFEFDNDSLCIGWRGNRLDRYDIESGELVESMASAVPPAAMLPGGRRYVGYNPVAGATGEFVLTDRENGRRVATLSDRVHVLTQCTVDDMGDCVSVVNKYAVSLNYRMTAEQATTALQQLDEDLEQRWFDRLAEHYASRPSRFDGDPGADR